MEYEDIARVNSEITMLPITKNTKEGPKTKDYAMVPERVTAFRKLYPEGFIRTEIISHENGVVLMNAIAGYYNELGNEIVLGTGFAQEDKSKGMINGTSYIENCETSAVGRALGFLGLGLNGGGICSAEELANAIMAQNTTQAPVKAAPVKKDAPATVEKIDKVPALQQKVEEAAEVDPVKKYLLQCMGDMREARQISAAENNKIFKAQRETLIKAKMIPDKKLEEYTMEEAQDMISKMYGCFKPTGTELVTE